MGSGGWDEVLPRNLRHVPQNNLKLKVNYPITIKKGKKNIEVVFKIFLWGKALPPLTTLNPWRIKLINSDGKKHYLLESAETSSHKQICFCFSVAA